MSEPGVPVEYYVLPTTPVELNLIQIGYLNAWVWAKVEEFPRDPIARQLFTALKDAAIRLGVEWYYGDLPPLPEAET